MKKLLYVLVGLCLLAGIFAGCEKKPLEEGNPNGGGATTEQTGTISGMVTEEGTSLPLDLVLVELTPGEKRTVTNQNGEFSIEGLMPGNYTLKVSKADYKTVEIGPITVEKGKTVRKEITMGKSDLRIVNEDNEDIEELAVTLDKKISFKILNTGTNILEWEILVAGEWILEVSKESGRLAPAGGTEKIDITYSTPSKDAEAVIYIMSKGGDKQLKLIYRSLSYTETALDLNMKMVAVHGGTFMMGSNDNDNEKPVHKVTLDGFYIGETEVTQAQWRAVMGPYRSSSFEGDNRPMDNVTFEEAQEFCKRLSETTGKKYVLPTEAQWEYAARGGNKSQRYRYAGSNDIDEVAWYSGNTWVSDKNHPDYGTHPVGTKKANELGIYDMSGNVVEWCSDYYDNYDENDTENPRGPEDSYFEHVWRGGCWRDLEGFCSVSYRRTGYTSSMQGSLGFRVVCISK